MIAGASGPRGSGGRNAGGGRGGPEPGARRVLRLWRHLLEAMAAAAAGLLVAVTLAIPLEVVLREGFNQSVGWLLDLVGYGMFVATLLGAPWVLSRSAHVSVDFLVTALGPRSRRLVTRIADGLGLVLSVAVCWVTAHEIARLIAADIQIRLTLVFPEWWLFAVVFVCFAACSIEFLVRLLVSGQGRAQPAQL